MKTELNIPSDIRFLKIVEDWLLGCLEAELGDSIDWPQQSSRLRLALTEAYSNVVRHAHRQHPNLPVLIRLELDGRNLKLEIWDYGEGYDLSTYLPPKPQAMQEHGYGWLILNRLMDNVEYRLQVNGRNCLSLAADLSATPSGADMDQTLVRQSSYATTPSATDDGPRDGSSDTTDASLRTSGREDLDIKSDIDESAKPNGE